MRVLCICEYFYPYIHGGAEVSTLEISKRLAKEGEKIFVLTPNYGSETLEVIDDVEVYRYSFPIKFEKFSDQLSPGQIANPVQWVKLIFEIIRLCQKENIEILHCQSTNLLPAVVVAGFLRRLPVVATFRDNQLLCNYGYCLASGKTKTCNLYEYFFSDFKNNWVNKVTDKNLPMFLTQFLYSLAGRLRTNFLKLTAIFVTVKIVSSDNQKRYFEVNGFSNVKRIYNLFPFSRVVSNQKLSGNILFASKLSWGKGLDLLLKSFVAVRASKRNVKLLVVGDRDATKYKSMCHKLGIDKSVVFKPMPEYKEVRILRAKSLLEVVPSIYPESFGRAALESLACGTPVVASNRGGLAEIVVNGKYGYVANPEENDLASGIIKTIDENEQLRRNILKDLSLLRKKFETDPIQEHIKMYKSLL